MSKKHSFIFLTIGLYILLIQFQSVFASSINVNDDFNGPTLRNDLWTERIAGTNLFPGQFASGDYMRVNLTDAGAYILESNFYYTDNFDITVSLNSNYGLGPNTGALRFYKYGGDHKAAPHLGGSDIGTLGDTWGFSGSPYGGFFEDQTYSWSYTPAGYNSFMVHHQWYQLRVERIGSMITTYHRLGRDSSNPWTQENIFFDFSGSIYIDLVTSQGTDRHNTDIWWDNFTSDILASTDPNGVSTIPEPTTMFLFGLGLLGIAGIGRRKNQKN